MVLGTLEGISLPAVATFEEEEDNSKRTKSMLMIKEKTVPVAISETDPVLVFNFP